MRGHLVPFDNIYTSPESFVARQTQGKSPYNRLFTWEFSRTCNSFVTIPIATLSSKVMDGISSPWDRYSTGTTFVSHLASNGLFGVRVLNLNFLFGGLGAIMARHRTLAGNAKIRGPFYIKARLENVWRTTLFIDIPGYMTHIADYGVPVVQNADMLVPPGASLESFILSPELDYVPEEAKPILEDGRLRLWVEIMQALGIPGGLLHQNVEDIMKATIAEAGLQQSASLGVLPP